MKLVSLETGPGPNISYPFHVQNVEADFCAIQALELCEREIDLSVRSPSVIVAFKLSLIQTNPFG
jgi:hypothetical protein